MPAARIVLSLDFELRWGVAHVWGTDMAAYRRNLEGVREAVPRLLEAFASGGVRATWATVAAIACDSWDEYLAAAPPVPPIGAAALARTAALPRLDPAGRLHFAPDLVRLVQRTPGQELGSHSFSHFPFAPRFTARHVEDDARAVAALFERKLGLRPESFVYPRNVVAFPEVLAALGLRSLRGNPPLLAWRLTPGLRDLPAARALRFAESLARSPPARRAPGSAFVPASAFLRLTLPTPLFDLHRARLAAAATRLREGEFLHLWFHPHNLGARPVEQVRRVVSVLSAITEATRGAATFCAMREV